MIMDNDIFIIIFYQQIHKVDNLLEFINLDYKFIHNKY